MLHWFPTALACLTQAFRSAFYHYGITLNIHDEVYDHSYSNGSCWAVNRHVTGYRGVVTTRSLAASTHWHLWQTYLPVPLAFSLALHSRHRALANRKPTHIILTILIIILMIIFQCTESCMYGNGADNIPIDHHITVNHVTITSVKRQPHEMGWKQATLRLTYT